MKTAAADTHATASITSSPAVPDPDSLLWQLGGFAYPVMAFPTDSAAGRAADDERGSEMDERIMTGLLWQ